MRQVRSPLLTSLVLAALFLLPAFATAQDHWTQVGNMANPRVFATTTALNDGRVLIVGGTDDGTNRYATVDISDPATATTVAGPPMTFGRYGHSAIKLSDGRVLVVGGLGTSGDVVAPIEIFNPVTNTWAIGADTPHLATVPALAVLPNGKVLVATTRDAVTNQFDNADIYDPLTNTWSPAATMNAAHSLPAVVALPDGRVMVAGGQYETSVEIYDPATDTWTTKASLNQEDTYGVSNLFLMSDGRIAFVGSTNIIEFYDVTADTWTPVAPNPSTVVYQVPMLLSDGRILLAGGVDGAASTTDSLNSTVIYDPATDSWSAGASMVAGHALGKAAKLNNGNYLIAGGYIGGNDVVEVTSPNHAPVANAGPDVSASTCDACVGGVVLNGGASSDPDGDALTYIWKEGPATLATTTQATTIVTLGPGPHTLTLTVRDTFGVENTDTVIVNVTNVEDGWRAMVASLQAQVVTLQGQVATLTSSNAILQAQLAACQAGGGGVNITPLMDGYEQYLRTLFRDPSFELPGTTSILELQNLLTALKKLDKDDEKKIYRLLGGHKMHQGHKGRTKPHWDDDCDYDEDNDHRR